MKACGVIVEYNPLHNGHRYHIQSSKELSEADCVIAVMSSSFLQRGEPAIIDKFDRTKAALTSGVDIVLELPYAYAVQHSDLFAYGAVKTLHEIGADAICFGSESGNISHFISSYETFKAKESDYNQTLRSELEQGVSFPRASESAFKQIGLTTDLNLAKPNNILGFSYVKTILAEQLNIEPLTIQRLKSEYHDQTMTGTISSATSLREQLLAANNITKNVQKAIPETTREQLQNYKQATNIWHEWEQYFPFIHYRVMTMTIAELAQIHDVDEGLEYRIKETAKQATSFAHWMQLIKTKRYTWTRLQRIFTHILTNTTKQELQNVITTDLPYVRMLGFTETGQAYLNKYKKQMEIPLITKLHRNPCHLLALEEKASNAYYSILHPKTKKRFQRRELQLPIFKKTWDE